SAPRGTLFPYTTLFRSQLVAIGGVRVCRDCQKCGGCITVEDDTVKSTSARKAAIRIEVDLVEQNQEIFDRSDRSVLWTPRSRPRSEEHTSELQSLRHLV